MPVRVLNHLVQWELHPDSDVPTGARIRHQSLLCIKLTPKFDRKVIHVFDGAVLFYFQSLLIIPREWYLLQGEHFFRTLLHNAGSCHS